ncbi:hypothetical protein CDD83_2628 [Cordyceps sp. RAO-2017]|nr:hypothetical protein CDD83_2628 [Cordyceps sp. RAO-2017]
MLAQPSPSPVSRRQANDDGTRADAVLVPSQVHIPHARASPPSPGSREAAPLRLSVKNLRAGCRLTLPNPLDEGRPCRRAAHHQPPRPLDSIALRPLRLAAGWNSLARRRNCHRPGAAFAERTVILSTRWLWRPTKREVVLRPAQDEALLPQSAASAESEIRAVPSRLCHFCAGRPTQPSAQRREPRVQIAAAATAAQKKGQEVSTAESLLPTWARFAPLSSSRASDYSSRA